MAGAPLLSLPADREAILRLRLNRFLAHIHIPVSEYEHFDDYAHVHDPGRLTELLFRGNRLLISTALTKTKRKTRWNVLAAHSGIEWVLINTGYHRRIADIILRTPTLSPFGSIIDLKPEVPVGESRLDFLVATHAENIMLEIKGCSLLEDGSALFPDAPTARGCKHMRELIALRSQGIRTAVIFLITQPRARQFRPNAITDPEFAGLFTQAVDAGVEIYPVVLSYDGQTVYHLDTVPYRSG